MKWLLVSLIILMRILNSKSSRRQASSPSPAVDGAHRSSRNLSSLAAFAVRMCGVSFYRHEAKIHSGYDISTTSRCSSYFLNKQEHAVVETKRGIVQVVWGCQYLQSAALDSESPGETKWARRHGPDSGYGLVLHGGSGMVYNAIDPIITRFIITRCSI